MLKSSKNQSAVLLIIAVLFLSACATSTKIEPQSRPLAYIADANDSFLARYAPIIIPEKSHQSYNQIGTPTAQLGINGNEIISIETSMATYYAQQKTFTSNNNTYINLIYRIHFQKVPFSLIPFNLTAGKNGGLLFVITLDKDGKPLLVTTVHTCGCYLAFIPTSYLPRSAYPDNWNTNEQTVFGIKLPARLEYPDNFEDSIRLVIYLQDQTHRVMDIDISSHATISETNQPIDAEIVSLDALKKLALNGGTTSFYKSSGFGKGYVKNSFKPFELLLMSWWTLDLYVGVDKEYGDSRKTGTIFYTSLKPWRRKESDMWDFRRFLDFWGWKF